MNKTYMTEEKYLRELARSYPDRVSVSSEMINLSAILELPKGTEHFLSDLHGEHEAFSHIRRNASGVIRRKIDALFEKSMTARERADFSTLIYYPEQKLSALEEECEDRDERYKILLMRLVELCRVTASKYTRSKVRKHLAKTGGGYEYIIDELLSADFSVHNKEQYYDDILDSIIRVGAATRVIIALCSAVKSLVIDHLHIVGDIYDRGPRADLILDELMREWSLDIQWGNHDVLWLGAAAGSRTCIAAVLNNSITYKNLDVVEIGYGISLRPLSLFASEVYEGSDVSNYMPKGNSGGDILASDDEMLIARMHKAISVIQFKLEGQTILRNPEFHMEHRLLLDKIDIERGTVIIEGKEYLLRDTDFPTIDPSDPYRLTDGEREVMYYLKNAFMRSEKLARHARFLYEKGEMYTVYNGNLLFHGCIPLCEDGSFMTFDFAEGKSGRALMDWCDRLARQGYFAKDGTEQRQRGKDFLWFLWCGADSPLCARKKITTFERLFVSDESAWDEPKNAYYRTWHEKETAERILHEFSLDGERSHIINGHIPVRSGEDPVKAGGRVILIDGGFCRAYQKTTGIAGYTLIYNAEGMRISAHEAFSGVEQAIEKNIDIVSDTVVFEHASDMIRVRDTDTGVRIREKIDDLQLLLSAYEDGFIKETASR